MEGSESGLFPLALVSAGGLVPDLGFRLVALLSEGADEVEDEDAAPPADAVDDESAWAFPAAGLLADLLGPFVGSGRDALAFSSIGIILDLDAGWNYDRSIYLF